MKKNLRLSYKDFTRDKVYMVNERVALDMVKTGYAVVVPEAWEENKNEDSSHNKTSQNTRNAYKSKSVRED